MTERLQLNVEKPREDLDLITVPDDREQLQLEKNISISQKHRFGIQKITAGDEKRLEKYLEPNSPACCKEKEKKHDTDRSVSGWLGICFSVAEPFKIFVGLNAGQDSFTVAKPTDAPLSLNQEQDTTSTTKVTYAPLVLNPDQDKIKGVEHSDGSRSLCPEQAALKVAEHSDGCLSIDHQQHQIKETYYKHGNRVRKDIYFRINRISVPIYLSSLVMIALCFFPDTSAFKVESGYTIFENLWGKSARYPPISKSVIEQNAAKVQAHGKPQQAERNDDGREQQTEENRKKREVEEAESREKQEKQHKLSRKRRMVASPAFPLDTTKDNYEIVTPIIKENGTLIIKFEHSEDEDKQKKCRVKLNTDQYSSKEQQDGNIIIEKSESLCTFKIKQFTMEKYVNATFTLDYGLDRIVETTLFWKTLINRVATYNPNDKKGIVTILTVGEHIQCSIQPPNIVNNKSEERGNIVTKKIFQYEKEQICLYNISCSIRGTFTSIINEIEMCKGVPTVPPLPTVFTTLPSYSEVTGYNATTDNYVYTNTTSSNSGSRSDIVDPMLIVIPVVIAFVIICLFVYLYIKRDKIKQWYRKRHDADESQDIEKGQEEIKMNVTKPDGVNISKTVTNQPLLQDKAL